MVDPWGLLGNVFQELLSELPADLAQGANQAREVFFCVRFYGRFTGLHGATHSDKCDKCDTLCLFNIAMENHHF